MGRENKIAYNSAKRLYNMDGGITVTLHFDEDNIRYLQSKFDITNQEDLLNAIYECVDTYMEM